MSQHALRHRRHRSAEHSPLAAVFVIAFTLALLMLVQLVCASQMEGGGG